MTVNRKVMFSGKGHNNFTYLLLILSVAPMVNSTNKICSNNGNCITRNRMQNRKRSAPYQHPPVVVGNAWDRIRAEGRWGSWGPWTCDALCGDGNYFRVRRCIPSDDFRIPVCHGRNIERSRRHCQAECPGIEALRRMFIGPVLSEAEKKAHNRTLSSSHKTFKKKVGEMIELDCNTELGLSFLTNYSKSSLFWERNGETFQFNLSRMSLREYSILGMVNLDTSDTGVYTCNVKFSKRLRLTILVFSLIVIGEPYDLNVTTDSEIPVKCNSKVLGKLFPGTQVQWIVNDDTHVLKDYGNTPPESVNEDIIKDAKENDTGLWICVVRDETNNKAWQTNAFYVKVSPSFILCYWRFLLSILQDPRWLASLLAAVLIAAVITIAFLQWRKRREKVLMGRLEAILKISAEIEREMQELDAGIEMQNGPKEEVKKQPQVAVKTRKRRRITKEVALQRNIQKALKQATQNLTETKPIGEKPEVIPTFQDERASIPLQKPSRRLEAEVKPEATSQSRDYVTLDVIRVAARLLQESSSTTEEVLRQTDASWDEVEVRRRQITVRSLQLQQDHASQWTSDEEEIQRLLLTACPIQILDEELTNDEFSKMSSSGVETLWPSTNDEGQDTLSETNASWSDSHFSGKVDNKSAEIES